MASAAHSHGRSSNDDAGNLANQQAFQSILDCDGFPPGHDPVKVYLVPSRDNNNDWHTLSCKVGLNFSNAVDTTVNLSGRYRDRSTFIRNAILREMIRVKFMEHNELVDKALDPVIRQAEVQRLVAVEDAIKSTAQALLDRYNGHCSPKRLHTLAEEAALLIKVCEVHGFDDTARQLDFIVRADLYENATLDIPDRLPEENS